MIILIGGIKGGSGKSTVATNLAIIRASADKDVLLVDADDQETASDFTIQRNEATQGKAGYTNIKLAASAVRTEILRLKQKYDDIIIDTGGRDTTSQRAGISIADVMLVPFVPRSFDIWTIERTATLVAEMQSANPTLKVGVFLNRVDVRGADNQDAEEALKQAEVFHFVPTPLGTRKAFGNAAALGLAVTELKPQDEKATAEILALYKYVFNMK